MTRRVPWWSFGPAALIALAAGCSTAAPGGSSPMASLYTSPMGYEAQVPAGWTVRPAAGSVHYDELQAPDGEFAIRIQTFDVSQVGTLSDMSTSDLQGILAQAGGRIDAQTDTTLQDGTPAHRIVWSASPHGSPTYGVDLLAEANEHALLMTLVARGQPTPQQSSSFDAVTGSVIVRP